MSTAKQFIAIVGLDSEKKPRAAKFDLVNAAAVRKAAQIMDLQTTIPKTDEQKTLVSKLSDGRLFASGKGLVPLIKRPLYDILIAKLDLDPAPKAETAKQPEPLAKQALPQAWLDLKVGSTVVAPDPADASENGWWPAVIVAVKGEQLVLRWLDAPKQKAATFLRSAVAILPPSSK